MSESKIDTSIVVQLKELLEDRFPELVERFNADGAARVSLLQTAVPEKNFDVVYAEAHGLKGSSRNIGANPLGDSCEALEECARVRDDNQIETLFAVVEQEFAAAAAALSSHL